MRRMKEYEIVEVDIVVFGVCVSIYSPLVILIDQVESRKRMRWIPGALVKYVYGSKLLG